MSQFIEMFKCSAERVALSSLCDTFIDGDWIEAKDQSDSGIRLIQTGNVGVGTFKDKGDKARYISEDTFNRLNCTEVVEGDILISRLPDPVGRACIIPAELGKSITAVDCTIIRLNDKVLPKFFVAFTSTPDYAMQIKKVLSGTTRLRVSRANLGKIQVPLPSVDKQQQFVTIAEQADKSGFDGFKSQFIEMFGGGNWPQKTLGEVGSFTRGGGFLKSDFVEHGIPCIHYGQIHTKFGPFITSHITEISSDLESKTKFASKGDLVIAITSEDTEGSCKSTAWLGDYPVAVGGHAAIYKHSMNPLYMSFFFKSTLFNYAKIEYVHGTKVFEIKPDDIAKILVPCPPMSLQNQFSAIAEQSDKSGSVGLKSGLNFAKLLIHR